MKAAIGHARITAVSWQSVAAGSCLALAGISFTIGITDVGVLLLALAAGFTVAHLRRRVETPKEPFEREDLTVRRRARLSQARAALESGSEGVLLISGVSGTGKTVLTTQLEEELRRDGDLHVIRQQDYGLHEADRLRQRIEGLGRTGRALIILDQLEKLFLLPEPAAEYHRTELERAIELVRTVPSWRCVLVVRRESFLDLTRFSTLRPLLGSVLVLGGFDPEVDGQDFTVFRNRLVKELDENLELTNRILADANRIRRSDGSTAGSAGAEADGGRLEVLPVEAVAAVEALRYTRRVLKRELSVESYENSGGLRGQMRVFFEALLERCGDRYNGARILSALSIEPRARRALSNEEIGLITGVPLDTVDRLVEFFEQAGLLRRTGGAKLDWAHDFFAERFNDLGGVFLDPAERDNIGHFWERLGADGKQALASLTPQSPAARWYTWGVFGLATAIVAGRLLALPLVRGYAEESIWSRGPVFVFEDIPGRVVDWSFLPAAVALVAWSWYSTALHRRVFARLGESGLGSALSYLVTGLTAAGAMLAVVFPRLWIALIGIAGLVVGLKYLERARQFGSAWMRTELFFGRVGRATCLNCSITILFGVAFAWFVSYGMESPQDPAIIAGILAVSGALLIYYAVAVTHLHVSRERVPLLIGIHRRYRVT